MAGLFSLRHPGRRCAVASAHLRPARRPSAPRRHGADRAPGRAPGRALGARVREEEERLMRALAEERGTPGARREFAFGLARLGNVVETLDGPRRRGSCARRRLHGREKPKRRRVGRSRSSARFQEGRSWAKRLGPAPSPWSFFGAKQLRSWTVRMPCRRGSKSGPDTRRRTAGPCSVPMRGGLQGSVEWPHRDVRLGRIASATVRFRARTLHAWRPEHQRGGSGQHGHLHAASPAACRPGSAGRIRAKTISGA